AKSARGHEKGCIPPMIDERSKRNAHLADDLRPQLQRVTSFAPRGERQIRPCCVFTHALTCLPDRSFRPENHIRLRRGQGGVGRPASYSARRGVSYNMGAIMTTSKFLHTNCIFTLTTIRSRYKYIPSLAHQGACSRDLL